MAHQKLAHGAWVFVGDGQKALFLFNEGDELYPNLRRLSVETHRTPLTHDQGSDAPGRAFSSQGDIRSSMAETDWHEIEKERFVLTIAERINNSAQAKEFPQIVIVAPPKILGELREALSADVTSKILAEIPKDLTHHTIAEIEAAVTAP